MPCCRREIWPYLQVTGWSEVTSPCVRGSPECFAGSPVTMADAVAASLRRAGRQLSFKLAVQDTWGPANEKGLPLLGVDPCSHRVDVPFQAPPVPVGGVFKFGSHSATRLQLPGHYRQAPRAAFFNGCKHCCGMRMESSWLHCENWHSSASIAALYAELTHPRQTPSLSLWDLCCCLSFLSTLRQIYLSGSCLTRCVPLLIGVVCPLPMLHPNAHPFRSCPCQQQVYPQRYLCGTSGQVFRFSGSRWRLVEELQMQRDLQNTLIDLLEPCKVGYRSHHVLPTGCCVTCLCPALQFHDETHLTLALKNLRRANFISSLKRTAVLQLADAQVDHHMDANPDLLGMDNCVVDLVSAMQE